MVMIEIRDKKKDSPMRLVDCIEEAVSKLRHRLEEQSSEDDNRYRRHRNGRYDEDEDDERDYEEEDSYRGMRKRSRY